MFISIKRYENVLCELQLSHFDFIISNIESKNEDALHTKHWVDTRGQVRKMSPILFQTRVCFKIHFFRTAMKLNEQFSAVLDTCRQCLNIHKLYNNKFILTQLPLCIVISSHTLNKTQCKERENTPFTRIPTHYKRTDAIMWCKSSPSQAK